MKFFNANRRYFLALIVVGICFVAGCRSAAKPSPSSGTEKDPTNSDFICFEYVGNSDWWGPPLAVCVYNPNPELKERIGKYLEDPAFSRDYLQSIMISPDDFRELAVPISKFVSSASQARGGWGTVRVTIAFESKVQSKDISGDDYELLLNKIPIDVSERNPGLAQAIKDIERYPPHPIQYTNQSSAITNEK